MKLNWLRAGCASIAECGEYTAHVYLAFDGWVGWVARTTGSDIKRIAYGSDSREAAEAACEAWLDQHDKPVWHDATEWLSWAEWRGQRLVVADVYGGQHRYLWSASRPAGWDYGSLLMTMDEAKAAAEKYVRKQTK